MQTVILVFIGILIVSFITGIFLTYLEKKNSNVVTVNNVNVVDTSVSVSTSDVVNNASTTNTSVANSSGIVVNNDNANNLKNDDDDEELEVLGETMSFDVPVIIATFNELEDIETI